jgi:hypothetical protein
MPKCRHDVVKPAGFRESSMEFIAVVRDLRLARRPAYGNVKLPAANEGE